MKKDKIPLEIERMIGCLLSSSFEEKQFGDLLQQIKPGISSQVFLFFFSLFFVTLSHCIFLSLIDGFKIFYSFIWRVWKDFCSRSFWITSLRKLSSSKSSSHSFFTIYLSHSQTIDSKKIFPFNWGSLSFLFLSFLSFSQSSINLFFRWLQDFFSLTIIKYWINSWNFILFFNTFFLSYHNFWGWYRKRKYNHSGHFIFISLICFIALFWLFFSIIFILPPFSLLSILIFLIWNKMK